MYENFEEQKKKKNQIAVGHTLLRIKTKAQVRRLYSGSIKTLLKGVLSHTLQNQDKHNHLHRLASNP